MKWLKKTRQPSNSGSVQNEPRLYVETITFADGAKLRLDRNSILVITGPNNSGKSSVLREIRDYFIDAEPFGPVVKSAQIKIGGNLSDFERVIIDRSVVDEWIGYLSIEGTKYNLGELEKHYQNSFFGCKASKAFFAHLAASERLGLTEPVRKGDYSTEAPNKPLQWLELEEDLEAKICADFERTFQMKLVLNRLGGAFLKLHVYHPSEHETVPQGNTRARAKWLASLQELHLQGDGMRSYVGRYSH
jgi:hypothetical protein